jgi:hypothetical protein
MGGGFEEEGAGSVAFFTSNQILCSRKRDFISNPIESLQLLDCNPEVLCVHSCCCIFLKKELYDDT